MAILLKHTELIQSRMSGFRKKTDSNFCGKKIRRFFLKKKIEKKHTEEKKRRKCFARRCPLRCRYCLCHRGHPKTIRLSSISSICEWVALVVLDPPAQQVLLLLLLLHYLLSYLLRSDIYFRFVSLVL